ncbi:amino acid ABC transporter permease [Alkalimarinus sediminis]|uniref:ABC transporter permease subunit n=1 Tax=Alkalimarinus sediminis TaxID=1632866 RepID=A0A9E8HIZ5_9ALTE|nr:ABC transporter permease subunit [Alkalimarinus sediminis]UZW75249.1 ABC transporter permease subunit [Alkalimarinus sediminis]
MFSKKTAEQIQLETRPSGNGATAFYNNPKYRGWIYQSILFVFIIGFFYSIISNTLDNMSAQGIKSGFSFLKTSAGFDVLMSLIPFETTDSYLRIFMIGILNTILVSIIGIIFSTILGFIFGIAYFSRNWLIKQIAIVYVEIFRNIPVILQVIFWYTVFNALPIARESLNLGDAIFLNVTGLYFPLLVGESGSGVVYGAIIAAIIAVFIVKRWAKKRQELTGEQFPVLWSSLGILVGLPLLALLVTGIPFHFDYPALRGFNFQGGVSVIPEFLSLAIALSVYTGAFIAEAVRAGIQSVPKGQTEAARSIGLKESKIMSLIIVPQSMRVITPMLNSEYQSLVKNTTIATAIGYPELFTIFAGSALNQVGQAIEIMFMTLAIYFAINMVISLVMNHFNKRTELSTR